MLVTIGQQCNVGENPTIILYSYINRHAESPNITKQKTLEYIVKSMVVTIYDNSAIEPYKNRGLSQQ